MTTVQAEKIAHRKPVLATTGPGTRQRLEGVLAHALKHPTHGARRVAEELMLRGFQIVLACFSRHVCARLYTSNMPVTPVQILNNHALLFFEKQGVKIRTSLSDNGREYCRPAGQAPLRAPAA